MNPNTIILGGLVALAGAGVAYGICEGIKAFSGTIEKLKEENRKYGEMLAK